jgi:hypothetical protein
MDIETGKVCRSRFSDGEPAAVHVLAGLTDGLADAIANRVVIA